MLSKGGGADLAPDCTKFSFVHQGHILFFYFKWKSAWELCLTFPRAKNCQTGFRRTDSAKTGDFLATCFFSRFRQFGVDLEKNISVKTFWDLLREHYSHLTQRGKWNYYVSDKSWSLFGWKFFKIFFLQIDSKWPKCEKEQVAEKSPCAGRCRFWPNPSSENRFDNF